MLPSDGGVKPTTLRESIMHILWSIRKPICIPSGVVWSMPRFVVEHAHTEQTCPAKDPRMAVGLLQIVAPQNAGKSGVTIHAEAVANGQHHLYLIVDAANAETVRTYLAPFAQVGSLTVTPASQFEEVVHRGAC